MDETSILQDLDTVFNKLRIWLPAVLLQVRAKPTDIAKVEQVLSLDMLVLIPSLRTLLKNHGKALLKRDVNYCRAVIFPPEYREVEIPKEIIDKGFDYVEVINELLEELSKVE